MARVVVLENLCGLWSGRSLNRDHIPKNVLLRSVVLSFLGVKSSCMAAPLSLHATLVTRGLPNSQSLDVAFFRFVYTVDKAVLLHLLCKLVQAGGLWTPTHLSPVGAVPQYQGPLFQVRAALHRLCHRWLIPKPSPARTQGECISARLCYFKPLLPCKCFDQDRAVLPLSPPICPPTRCRQCRRCRRYHW